MAEGEHRRRAVDAAEGVTTAHTEALERLGR
jgi:hypothetical protein